MNNTQWMSFSSQIKNPNISALISFRSFNDQNKKDSELLASQYGFIDKKLIIPKQIHSSKVFFTNKKGIISNCDGTFSSEKKLICSIEVADCMPIYFAHKFEIVYGLIHAGWRGLVNNIILLSGELLVSNNYRLKDFDVIIGPSIQNCCFEVKKDVIDQFDEKFIQKKITGGYAVDLQAYATNHLLKSGFSQQNITRIKDCTYCMSDFYFSYRRNNENKNRMIGLIGMQ